MRASTDNERFSSLSIGVHWLTLLLMIALYAVIELRGLFPRGSDPRETMKDWHNILGLVVLALVFIRVAVLLAHRPPAISPTPPRLQQIAAKTVHLALYLFLLGMPLLGWATLSAQGKPVGLPGLPLPAMLAADRALGHQLEEIHETIGTLGYYLIGLHAMAALFHHYIMRDDTLLRMLPWRRVGAMPSPPANGGE